MTKYGYWEIIDISTACKANYYKWMCRCICGTEKLVVSKYLRDGKSKSCGCHGLIIGQEFPNVGVLLHHSKLNSKFRCSHGKEFYSRIVNRVPRAKCCPCLKFELSSKAISKHGEAAHWKRTAEYRTWKGIKSRCLNPDSAGYARYGGRGIKICERWINSYENFLSDMGRRPEGYSIDRINGNGDYEPKNCRWASTFTQAENRPQTLYFFIDDVKKSLAEWCRIYGQSRHSVWQRIRNGMTIKDALNQKKRIKGGD